MCRKAVSPDWDEELDAVDCQGELPEAPHPLVPEPEPLEQHSVAPHSFLLSSLFNYLENLRGF